MSAWKLEKERPLSIEWWDAFCALKPPLQGAEKLKSYFLNKQSMQRLQPCLPDSRRVLVIGGKPAPGQFKYVSSDEITRFLDSAVGEEYNKNIEIGHIAEYFLETQYMYAGETVHHASALDSQEIFQESRSAANRTGLCEAVADEVLLQRADDIFDPDKYGHAADVIILNFDTSVPVPYDVSFDEYMEYVSGRHARARKIIVAVARAWRLSLEGAKAKPREMIVVLNSLLGWLPQATRGQARDDGAQESKASKEPSILDIRLEKFKACFNIDLYFMPIIEIAPHSQDFVESDWRAALNTFSRHGHKQSVKKRIGFDLMTRIIGGIDVSTKDDSRNIAKRAEEYTQELYDRVLSMCSPSTMAVNPELTTSVCVARHAFIEEQKLEGWVWMSDDEDESDEAQDEEDDSRSIVSSHAPGELMPMLARCVLIFDSGRDDGVTEALCKSFCSLGANIVVTYVCDDLQDGTANAQKIVYECRDLPGSVAIVRGSPFRSQSWGSVQPPHSCFVEDLVDRALLVLNDNVVHCIVNNVGWQYSLHSNSQTEQERMHLIQRDSRRNLLALDYLVTYITKLDVWWYGGTVINIAGLGCNPAIPSRGPLRSDDWEFLSVFTDNWSQWLYNSDDEQDGYNEVSFTSIIPGDMFCRQDDWNNQVVAMYNRWRSDDYVRETTKIIRIKADRHLPSCTSGFIVPNETEPDKPELEKTDRPGPPTPERPSRKRRRSA